VLVMMAWPRAAAADPIFTLPAGRELLSSGAGSGSLAVLGDVDAIGVAWAERLSDLPDFGAIDELEPDLGRARAGLVGRHGRWPLAFMLRVDWSEALRHDRDQLTDETAGVLDGFVDDASVWWSPRVWAGLVAGRGKVPFSRFRHLDRALLSGAVMPFASDRLAPDRRWGITALGDLGALSYAAGVYADYDSLELRTAADDPSAGGKLAAAAHLEWTPRAPIGSDHRASPTRDPWHGVGRASLGAGVLYRRRAAERGDRLDLSVSSQVKMGRYAAICEGIVSADDSALGISGVAEASVMIGERVVAFMRGDVDIGVDLWTAGGGASYFVTSDRRNVVSLLGWVRRQREVTGEARDGVVIKLQAGL
jgi:hypothetical protein